MRLFRFEYTLVGDLKLPASPHASGVPQTRVRCTSILLAADAAQAEEAIMAWRSDDPSMALWNPQLEEVTFTSYYETSGTSSPVEVLPGSNERPLLIATGKPQEIFFTRR